MYYAKKNQYSLNGGKTDLSRLKDGFHQQRSRRQSWSRKRIRGRKIRTFPFSSDSAYDSVVNDLVRTRLSESEAEAVG